MQLRSPSSHPFVLGSASPRRRDLIAQMGLVADEISAPDIDETHHRYEKPADYAARMASEKANALIVKHPNSYILSADTVVAVGRRILPKTETLSEASACLDLLMGRAHTVYGGLCLITPDGQYHHRLSVAKVAFRRLSDDEKTDYLRFGDWQGKAGGYAIQGMAASFIHQLQGSYSNVVGLDIYLLSNLLRHLGFRPDDGPLC